MRAYLAEPNVSMLCMHETAGQKRITAIVAVKRVDSIDLLTTFGDQDIAAYIRSMAAGSIAVIGGLFCRAFHHYQPRADHTGGDAFRSCWRATIPM